MVKQIRVTVNVAIVKVHKVLISYACMQLKTKLACWTKKQLVGYKDKWRKYFCVMFRLSTAPTTIPRTRGHDFSFTVIGGIFNKFLI